VKRSEFVCSLAVVKKSSIGVEATLNSSRKTITLRFFIVSEAVHEFLSATVVLRVKQTSA
jgi:hypothetical protein